MAALPLTDHSKENSTLHFIHFHRSWATLLAIITIITLAVRYALPVRDGDLWWHMLYGKFFLEHKTLIADHTIFSWSPTSNDTIYCTWLPDIFLYLLHKATGLYGLFTFRYLCMFFMVFGFVLFARKLKIANNPIIWLFCLLAVLMSYTAAYLKPEIFSFVFITLFAWNWWYIRTGDDSIWKNCYFFPLILLIWVNSHGAFVFGCIFLFLGGIGEILNTWLSPDNTLSPKVRKHLAIALILSLLIPFFTPYGFQYPLQLLQDLLPTAENLSYNNKIASYMPTFAYANPFGLALHANIAVIFLIVFSFINLRRLEWSFLLLNIVFVFLYTLYFRTTFYWAPIFLFSILPLVAMSPFINLKFKHRKIWNHIYPIVILISSVLISANAIYQSFYLPEKFLWVGFGISDTNPVSEAAYIKRYFPKSRIGNTYSQGAYLLWKIWPENTVLFDSRHFPYRKWSDTFFNFAYGNNVNEFLEKYPCDLWCIGWSYPTLIITLLESGKWKLAYYGRNAAVLLPKHVSLPSGTPQRSKDFFHQKNLPVAIEALITFTLMKDWSISRKLLDSMAPIAISSEQKSSLLWANIFYKGMIAFDRGEIRESIKQFERLSTQTSTTRFMLTLCYLNLSGELWQMREDTAALNYVTKAHQIVPANPYSLYNLGIINRQLQLDGKSTSSEIQWESYLEEFLRVAPNDRDFDLPRSLAKSLLLGKGPNRPMLLLPSKSTISSNEHNSSPYQ